MKKRVIRKGTLVYLPENGHCAVYMVMSAEAGKVCLALPWRPTEPVLRGVDRKELERVF